ncbi:Tyrosine-protein kinase [Parasponia andersonii]|uniref:Tyrosine-protein kinase n=1 Tax=Parasponia andersonii TaxID=3476 RepID=A0A2P5DWZ1_PARAD|nr:Tyrosine-protein kinase [Parasponia andersonii]
MFSGFRNNENKVEKNGFFLKNGAAVLEQLILLFDGKCNQIRTYSAEDLKRATDNFDWSRMIHESWDYTMYKGLHEDCEISVKKFISPSHYFKDCLKWISNEVAVASLMSNHKNVLKLLGCCLETELPMLVYEFPRNGNLSRMLDRDGGEQLPFETRLRIAIEIANAVAYLHHGLSKTFIHRDIHRGQVFLDQDYGAKLFEFQASIPIPEGETHVDGEVFGTKGFGPPEVMMCGRYTERSDVYDFGILLCHLLIGKRCDRLIWDPENRQLYISDDLPELCKRHLEANMSQGENRAQMMECAELAKRCVKLKADDRPNMIEVAKALVLIKSIHY